MIYADDVSILSGSVRTIKKSVEGLAVIELEVNADKNKYMVKSPDQDVGRCHIINLFIVKHNLLPVNTCMYIPSGYLKSFNFFACLF